MSSKDRGLEAPIYSRSNTYVSHVPASPHGTQLHLKRMETHMGEQGGTPLRWADVMDRAGLDIPPQRWAVGAAVVHSVQGQIRATPMNLW
jgi:hypothetical protein